MKIFFSVNSVGQCEETKNFILNDTVRKLRTEFKGIFSGKLLGDSLLVLHENIQIHKKDLFSSFFSSKMFH